jgi:hypothetical protein
VAITQSGPKQKCRNLHAPKEPPWTFEFKADAFLPVKTGSIMDECTITGNENCTIEIAFLPAGK